jgi:hypothetical protein
LLAFSAALLEMATVAALTSALAKFVAASDKVPEDALSVGAYKQLALKPAKAASGTALVLLAPLLSPLFKVAADGIMCQVPLKTAIQAQLGGSPASSELKATELAAGLRCAASHLRRIKRCAVKWLQCTRWLQEGEKVCLSALADTCTEVPWFEVPADVRTTVSAMAAGPTGSPTPTAGGCASARPSDAGNEIFSDAWDPLAFAASAAKHGGLKRCRSRGSAGFSQVPEEEHGLLSEVMAKKRARAAAEGHKAEVVSPVVTPKKKTGQDTDTPAKATESAGVLVPVSVDGRGDAPVPKGGRKALYAAGIGKLHLSVGETRSELCYVAPGETKRRHAISACSRETVHHRSLFAALVRLACETDMDLEGLRKVKTEKLRELQASS